MRFGFGRRASRLPELWQVTPVCASFQREEETVALDLGGPLVPESGCGDKWMHGMTDRQIVILWFGIVINVVYEIDINDLQWGGLIIFKPHSMGRWIGRQTWMNERGNHAEDESGEMREKEV